MRKNTIPGNLYKKIVSVVPLCCVDLVIKSGDAFLLVKRLENPAKGKWWLVGGRVLFNETLLAAVKRKLKTEVGINPKKILKIEPLGIKEIGFKRGKFNKPVYSIAHVFLVKLSAKESFDVTMDSTMSGYQWHKTILKSFDPYIKEFLKKASFHGSK